MTMQKLEVLAKPNARKNELVGVDEGGRLIVKLKARPIEGQANKALCAFLAQCLKVAKSRVKLVKGQGAKYKSLEILGVEKRAIEALKQQALAGDQ